VVGDGPPAPEAIPEMMLEVETMVATIVVAPSLPHETTTGGPAASPGPVVGVSSSSPCSATAVDATADVAGESEVVMGHATFHMPDDVSLDEVVSTASWALSQVQCVLRWEDGDLIDERQRPQLWTSLLKEEEDL
jgi:hypothetical protein